MAFWFFEVLRGNGTTVLEHAVFSFLMCIT